MKLITAMFLLIAACAGAQTNLVLTNLQSLQGMIEERDLLARMSVICKPDFWVSSNGVLYLQPKTFLAEDAIGALKNAKHKYLVLTNANERRDLIAHYITTAFVDKKYQEMILHPKELSVGFYHFARYKMVQSLENGDALIQDDDDYAADNNAVYYVSGLGCAADDKYYGDAELIRNGLKTYTTVIGGTKTVEAYRSVALNRDEEEVLRIISANFSMRVSELTEKINLRVAQSKPFKSK